MQNQSSCCRGSVGIVQGTPQQLRDIYPFSIALRQGTLYPELDKPMACAPVPTGCAAATEQQELGFAAWDVRLYLDTHPNDERALQLFAQLCQQPTYASAFLPCAQGYAWPWVDAPWPWELEANERKG